uniref:oxygenase MpaB family protein n=1 Tax=Candidatus Planktophila sp. TaxID=2175601 RepID=UPI004048EBC1
MNTLPTAIDPRGLFTPNSVTWRIHSDPAMAVGGIRALLQQALHPDAMDGVAKNSNFREDAWGRLQRTGDYVSTLTFGSSEEAFALATRVRKIHTSLGLDDPHLLLWVHMSMVDSFLDVAIRSGMAIDKAEADQYVSEMVLFAQLVGIATEKVPATVSQMEKYFTDISPELRASEDAKRAALFLTIPPLPTAVRFATPAAPAWASLALLAGSSLPSWARSLYGTPQLPGQIIATDFSLKAIRSAMGVIPDAILAPPIYKEAMKRWDLVSYK